MKASRQPAVKRRRGGGMVRVVRLKAKKSPRINVLLVMLQKRKEVLVREGREGGRGGKGGRGGREGGREGREGRKGGREGGEEGRKGGREERAYSEIPSNSWLPADRGLTKSRYQLTVQRLPEPNKKERQRVDERKGGRKGGEGRRG